MSVLADRYATAEMREIFSPTAKIILERKFWISILKNQSELGLDIPASAIKDYEKVKIS